MRTFSPDVKLSDEFITSKNTNLTRFFIPDLDAQVDYKNRSGWKNPQGEPWSYAAKRLIP